MVKPDPNVFPFTKITNKKNGEPGQKMMRGYWEISLRT